MNDKLIAYLDAMLAAAQEDQARSEQAAAKATDGMLARTRMAENAEFVAMLRPAKNGTLTGPWVDVTCPSGHVIGPVRAIHDGYALGQVHIEGGRKVQERTTQVSHLQTAGRLIGAFPERENSPWIQERRVWTCPQCGAHRQITEVFLMRLYVGAVAGCRRRVAFDGT